jgi:hypothetical protein
MDDVLALVSHPKQKAVNNIASISLVQQAAAEMSTEDRNLISSTMSRNSLFCSDKLCVEITILNNNESNLKIHNQMMRWLDFPHRERSPEKESDTSVCKVYVITEKLRSKIRINLPENLGKALEERRYS